MKVIQFVTRRQYRGAEVFAAELSKQLSMKGHDVIFAGLYLPGSNILSAENCINVDIGGNKIFFNLFLLWRIVKMLKKNKPDIVQANGSDTLKYIVFAKYFLPELKIFYRNISMVSGWSQVGSLKRKFNKFLFKKVDFVTSVGQKSLMDLVKAYQFPLDKTKLINRGIPQLKFDKGAARNKLSKLFGFENNDRILAHVGNFSPEKNHTFLLEVFGKIFQEQQNIKLIFIGEGVEMEEIKSRSEKWGKHVCFPGLVTNVQEYLAGCDLFILGSTVEGVPGVVVEAAIQSVPSVAVNVGGVSEVIIHNVTGMLIPNHDSTEFAKTVLELLNNETLIKVMGEKAKDIIAKDFSLENCSLQFEKLYESVRDKNK